MRAGGLDRLITIQRKAKVGDPEYVAPDANYGTSKVVWVPLAKQADGTAEKFSAQVQDSLPSRSESISLGANFARNLTRVRLRYRDDIDSTMQVLLHGDGDDIVYQIIGGPANVVKDGRKTLIELLCERYS